MKFYSFENLTINKETGLYDLFKKTVVSANNVFEALKVTKEIEYRPDLLSKKTYGTTDYVEETLVMNNIINPFAIMNNTTIFKAYSSSDLNPMYKQDKNINEENKNKILNVNKNKTSKSFNYPPPIKPDNLTQLDINYSQKKITIINKFK